jgi:thiamine biosynthesis lipoprotein
MLTAMRVQSFLVFAAGLLLLAVAGCRQEETGSGLEQFSGRTMGTTYTVKLVSVPTGAVDTSDLQKKVEGTLDEVNAKMSNYLEDSEISRFNNWNRVDPFEVSSELLKVLSLAKETSAATGGAFDITVAPLVNAWGFGPPGRMPEAPDVAQIEILLRQTGWDQIEIDSANSTIKKTHEGLIADLSAIAKGYGVDRVVDMLETAGLDNFMVEIGGEVGARGLNRDAVPWRIGIERPIPEQRAIELVVPLSNLALATSGDYRNYYEVEGKRISHTIDPRTGYPLAHSVASVSVVHPDCAEADAYATGLLVLGAEGFDLAEDLGLAAYFLMRESNEAFSGRMTTAFKELLEESNNDSVLVE